MRIALIRHAATEGNRQRRYIGITDQPIADDAFDGADIGIYPAAEAVVTSPMLRCKQTAGRIYGGIQRYEHDGLSEYDFGMLEGKNYEELKDIPEYISWLASGGRDAFPSGEGNEEFCRRSCDAFREAVKRFESLSSLAFVVHGGTIMAVLEHFAPQYGSFYDFHLPNLGGYKAELDVKEMKITLLEKI